MRAVKKEGMAMTASNPMIATVIMISIKVKPARFLHRMAAPYCDVPENTKEAPR